MKRILSVILLLAIALSLVGCGSEFEPVPSTDEEAKTVLTIEYDGEKYEVAYELYRAFFLTYKKDVDEGNADAWTGDEASESIEKINGLIFDSIAEIYSAFYLCDKLGININSKKFDEKVDEYISASVDNIIAIYTAEAAEAGETLELSREEAYQIYLQRLKADNLNYSTSVLLYRYELALAAIDEYYRGEASSSSVTGYKGGELEFTKEDVKDFYDSDDTVKIIQFCKKKSYTTKSDVERIRNLMAEAASKDAVLDVMNENSLSNSPDGFEKGIVIGKYTLDKVYFSAHTEAAFSLEIGEVSDVIEAFDGESDAYYILYRDAKSDAHFEDNYADIAYAYVSDAIGRAEETARGGILASIKLADGYSDIIHEYISI